MPKRSVAFTKPAEPKFLKKMKEQMGYQEPDTVETKRQNLSREDDDDNAVDDEKPTIVVLKPGDLTEAEFEKEMEDKVVPEAQSSGKMVFTKPKKNAEDESNISMHFSSKGGAGLKQQSKTQSESSLKVKNSSLLSFDDDEDEED